jgi:hypothetical protein
MSAAEAESTPLLPQLKAAAPPPDDEGAPPATPPPAGQARAERQVEEQQFATNHLVA